MIPPSVLLRNQAVSFLATGRPLVSSLSSTGHLSTTACQMLPEMQESFSVFQDKVNDLVTMMRSTPTLEIIGRMQRFGDQVFLAALIVAFLQAFVAMLEYQTNPSGELIVPPGPTYGSEDPMATRFLDSRPSMDVQLESKDCSDKTDERTGCAKNLSSNQSLYVRLLDKVNSWMALTLPFVWEHATFIRYLSAHVWHIAFIVTLMNICDFPHFVARTGLAQISPEKDPETFSFNSGQTEKVIVVGDSLAVGLGSVNIFDKNKDSSVERKRLENVEPGNGMQSPVYPKVLAQSLAKTLGKPVHWRSAGVDGGDVQNIHDACLGVIEEEVAKGEAPDVVVIICGMNDLKNYIARPMKAASPEGFRTRLTDLISRIRELAPNTKVILPAIPTQMFHMNSPLNIFPLVLFLDSIVGFWDSQKKRVAERFPSDGVEYIGISAQEVLDWYKADNSLDGQRKKISESSLISADGVHPSARCYALWAEAMANKIVARDELYKNRQEGDEGLSLRWSNTA